MKNLINNKHKKEHKEILSYMVGFILSMILTVIPFLAVSNQKILQNLTFFIILTCAIFQILVHLIYFLHLNQQNEKKWNIVSMVFSMIVIAIIISGSLWIMQNLNHNMIPH